MFRKLAWTAAIALCGFSGMGCRNGDGNTITPADFSMVGGNQDLSMPGGNQDLSTSGCGGNYTNSTIAAMRMGQHSGCYSMANVVVIANKPEGSTSVKAEVYVQDSAGGDFTAMQVKCGTTAHPCADPATYKALAVGHSVTVAGTYIRSAASKFEEFYIDSIADNGAGTAPPAATAALADIQRGGMSFNLVFQKVTLTIAAADKLGMYDWSPSEFFNATGTANCSVPFQFGFGMIPASVTGVTPTGACTTTTQPPGQTTPNAGEVLVDTRFYKGFTYSSDCHCAPMFSDTIPTATSTVSGTASGIIIFDTVFGTNNGYMAIAPVANADFMLTP